MTGFSIRQPASPLTAHMNDFKTAVSEAHYALVEAGNGWAQPQRLSEAEKLDTSRLLLEWILAQAKSLKALSAWSELGTLIVARSALHHWR